MVCSLLLLGCSLKNIKNTFLKTSPYENYLQSLHRVGLREASLTKEWTEAGERAFHDSIELSFPYTESGFFEATEPQARGYRFNVHAGQMLNVSGQTKSANGARLFTNLFTWEENK